MSPMPLPVADVTNVSTILLFVAIGLALTFEFVNGFHDTANAVATVIYTHTLNPFVAVVWSGLWNLIGALTSSGAVAFGVIALLPMDLVLNVGSAAGVATVFALLIAAIMWNLGTWYLGLPASSSHALIGSIMGVGLANSLMAPGLAIGEGVNWSKASEVGLALIISPIVGFCAAALLLLLMKVLIRRPELYRPPDLDKPPPFWIRSLLVVTCTGVSFAHGSNDGQKGMGLIMLILIGLLPATYALRLTTSDAQLQELLGSARAASALVDQRTGGVTMAGSQAREQLAIFLKQGAVAGRETYAALASEIHQIGRAHV